MRRRSRKAAVLIFVFLALAGFSCAAQSLFRSVGLRAILPWTGLPLLVGVEGTADLSFGIGVVSFFLTSRGQALLSLSADIELSAPTNPISTAVRLTGGIAYLDPDAYAPNPFLGGGVRYEIDLLHPILLGVSAELLYPIAFPLPMISGSVGWSLP